MRKKQRAKRNKDTKAAEIPEKPKSAYLLFYHDRCKQLKLTGVKKNQKNEMQQDCSRMWNEMTKVEKQPYEEQVKKASTMYQEWMSTQKKKCTIKTRISLRTILETVSKLTPDQLEAVKSIGFGSLTHLRCTRVNHAVCEWLVKNFDHAECSLTAHGRKVMLTPVDVEKIMGIGADGAEVRIQGPANAIAEMSEKYGFKSGLLNLKTLKEDVQSMEEAGDEFKVKFVLLALGCIFCPSLKPGINQYYLHSLLDVSTISKMNWAKLLLDYLVKGVHNYKENNQAGVSGCVLFLMLFYFETFIPVGLPLTSIKSGSYPLMGMWANEDINSRVRFLTKKGLFTNQKILLLPPKEEPQKETPAMDAEPQKETQPIDAEASKETPPNDGKEEGLRAWMNKVDIELVQIKSDIRSLVENFNSFKMEMVNTIRLVNELVARGHQPQRERGQSPSFRESPQNEERFCPDNVVDLSAFKTVEKVTEGPIRQSPRRFVKRKEDMSHNGSSPPLAFRTPLAPVEDVSPNSPTAKKRKKNTPKFPHQPVPLRRSPRKAKAVHPTEEEGHSVTSKARTRVVRMPSRYKVSPYTTGKGKAKKGRVEVPFIENVQKLFDTTPTIQHTLPVITQEEYMILDYVLDKNQPMDDVLVKYILEHGNRKTLQTLGSGCWVSDNAINLVVGKLTCEERARHVDNKCTRWFFPTYLSTQICARKLPSITELSRSYLGFQRYTTEVASVEMIFVPVHDNGHWFLCSIDMNTKMVYICDPMPSPANNKRRYTMVVKIINQLDLLFSRFYGQEYQTLVATFEIMRLTGLPEQQNGDDCGIFVILFMQFLGTNPGIMKFEFSSELARSRMIVDLVDSEHNAKKSELQQKIEDRCK